MGHQSEDTALRLSLLQQLFDLRFIHINYWCIFFYTLNKIVTRKTTSIQHNILTDYRLIQVVCEGIQSHVGLQLIIFFIIIMIISQMSFFLRLTVKTSKIYSYIKTDKSTKSSHWRSQNQRLIGDK